MSTRVATSIAFKHTSLTYKYKIGGVPIAIATPLYVNDKPQRDSVLSDGRKSIHHSVRNTLAQTTSFQVQHGLEDRFRLTRRLNRTLGSSNNNNTPGIRGTSSRYGCPFSCSVLVLFLFVLFSFFRFSFFFFKRQSRELKYAPTQELINSFFHLLVNQCCQ